MATLELTQFSPQNFVVDPIGAQELDALDIDTVIIGMVKKTFGNEMNAVKSYCSVSHPCDDFRSLSVDTT